MPEWNAQRLVVVCGAAISGAGVLLLLLQLTGEFRLGRFGGSSYMGFYVLLVGAAMMAYALPFRPHKAPARAARTSRIGKASSPKKAAKSNKKKKAAS